MLTAHQNEKFAARFRALDVDGSGSIGWEDYQAVIARLAHAYALPDGHPAMARITEGYRRLWETISRCADADGGGRITYGEFMSAAERISGKEDCSEVMDMRALADTIIGILDTDGDGNVGLGEFVRWSTALGSTERDAADAFAEIDTNGSGTITREEIFAAAENYFTAPDPAVGAHLFGRLTGC